MFDFLFILHRDGCTDLEKVKKIREQQSPRPRIETPQIGTLLDREPPGRNIGPGTDTPPSHGQTPVKILPCPKLPLWAVITE